MPVIYKEKVEYAYTDPGVKAHTLSWAEYQALPTAQKMNGDLYFIPDKQPEGNPSRIWDKLGTEPLDTEAEDVSGAVNELNSSLTNKTYNIVLLRFSFNKVVNAGADLEYSVSGTDLNALVNDEVISANVHLAGSTGQPIYTSHSIVRTSISSQLYNPIISGHIYNPSTSNRTYAMEVECLVKRAFNWNFIYKHNRI